LGIRLEEDATPGEVHPRSEPDLPPPVLDLLHLAGRGQSAQVCLCQRLLTPSFPAAFLSPTIFVRAPSSVSSAALSALWPVE